MKQPVTAATDAKTGRTRCHLPPLITDIKNVAQALVCGFDPSADMARFKLKYRVSATDSIESLCGSQASAAVADGPPVGPAAPAFKNQRIYRCSGSGSAGCTLPTVVTMEEALRSSATTEYSGLAYMVLATLYDGMLAVAKNEPLPAATIALLNSANYPLYRLLNLAAVYPGQAEGLLSAFGATIAVHYSMDVLTKLMTPGGSTTQVSMIPENGIQQKDLLRIRADIMEMTRTAGDYTNTILKRLSEKQALVDQLVKVNKALQAEVVSQGLVGNSSLAASIKRYEHNVKP